MRTIIAGSRGADPSVDLISATVMEAGFLVTEVVSGRARGADLAGERWAFSRGISIKLFPVTSEDWNKYGKSAGHRRNRLMAEYGDALIAFWDGKSRGTAGMIEEMKRMKKPVHVYRTD